MNKNYRKNSQMKSILPFSFLNSQLRITSNVFFVVISLLFSLLSFSQSQDKNYIKTIKYKKETTQNTLDPTNPTDAVLQVQYFDGLGRPVQQVAYKQSGEGNDIIIPMEYDGFGRQAKDFLPYVRSSSTLDFDSSALSSQSNYYSSSTNPNFETTNFPFSEKIYDGSPLNRVMRQSAPGASWAIDSGHEVKYGYDLNSESDEVFRFKVTKNGINYTLECLGYYNPNTIYKNTVKNENWQALDGVNNTTEEYVDNLDRTVLKRSFNNGQKFDTYYIYDAIGNLTYVVPPQASDNIVSVQTNQTPYTYSQYFNISEFLIDSSGNPVTAGGGGMSIQIQNSTISLNLSAGLGVQSTFDLTKQFQINAVAPIPDMILGYVDFYYTSNHQFIVKIENNKLFFEDYDVNNPQIYFTSLPGISQNLSKPLDSNVFGGVTTYSYTLNFSEIENLGYQYKYDTRNRIIEKKLPGKDWEYIIYDRLDRPVANGPAFTPYGGTTLGWMITEYDVFGRVTQTGWKQMAVSSTDRATYQDNINSGSNPFTLAIDDLILTKNFYDSYTYPGAPSLPTDVEGQALATDVKGLLTGSWVKVMDATNPNAAEIGYSLYDVQYRPVRSYVSNSLGGYTQIDNKLDWAGKTLYTITINKHDSNSANIFTVRDNYTYTEQDRLSLHTQQVNGGVEQLIVKNTYDELGQLVSKNVGGTDTTGNTALQIVDYTYNIRGWLKNINDVNNLGSDLFAFKIRYNDAEEATPLFNGNIAETYWKTSSDNKLRRYNYAYDHLNRLLDAKYERVGETTPLNAYRETINYDKNGNIKDLSRYGVIDDTNYTIPMDDLIYHYDINNKNQLMRVDDNTNSPEGFVDGNTSGDDYEYDDYGNLTRDKNKHIQSITYNHYNLPTHILFEDGNEISYLYSATGQKISKKVSENSVVATTEYLLGGFQYLDGLLQFFPHAEGYVKYHIPEACSTCRVSPTFKYVFNYTDHLGNIRLSYSDVDGNGFLGMEHTTVCFTSPKSGALICNDYFVSPVLEENHYYPYGLKHQGYNADNAQPNYKYKYNGKELQNELGLNMYDLGARMYDPALARFMVQDPMADFVNYQSPYVASDNNPVLYRDEYGLGILNVIGNLFRRAKNGVKRIFSGKNCNCGGREESIAESWEKPDFGWYGSDKGSSRSYKVVREPFMGELQNYLTLQPFKALQPPTVNFKLPMMFEDFDFILNVNISFKSSSDVIRDSKKNNEVFDYILKTLKEYPQITLFIRGNGVFDKPNVIMNRDSQAYLNNISTTVSALMLARARAIEAYLIRNGIDWRRIKVAEGDVLNNKGRGNNSIINFRNVPKKIKKYE